MRRRWARLSRARDETQTGLWSDIRGALSSVGRHESGVRFAGSYIANSGDVADAESPLGLSSVLREFLLQQLRAVRKRLREIAWLDPFLGSLCVRGCRVQAWGAVPRFAEWLSRGGSTALSFF
jgi:hypothetical protein